ncbi:hypothetical protein NQ315_017443 [Exocentrus adspersus]|uniref:Uncharacterized protein n=1 Tax=Exocentrus adspersus TaxID=1586481 RepID=A0AAV8VK43_9CUCU|nr:hypothetical protein NQ315_017443 [Exocentrus adspersus]
MSQMTSEFHFHLNALYPVQVCELIYAVPERSPRRIDFVYFIHCCSIPRLGIHGGEESVLEKDSKARGVPIGRYSRKSNPTSRKEVTGRGAPVKKTCAWRH